MDRVCVVLRCVGCSWGFSCLGGTAIARVGGRLGGRRIAGFAVIALFESWLCL